MTLHRHHDLGGAAAASVTRVEHDLEPWEQTVEAMMWLLSQPGRVLTIDQVRRAIEDMGADAYARLSYYERWTAALAQVLLEAGVVTVEDLAARLQKPA